MPDRHQTRLDRCWARKGRLGPCNAPPDPDDRLGLCSPCGRRLRATGDDLTRQEAS